MKLKTKILHVTDAAGNDIDLDDIPVDICHNGSKTSLTLDQLLVGHSEFDEGEIYGQTLLSYFTPGEDGRLYYENSVVELVTEHGPLRITGIRRPGTNDDENITLDTIREFSRALGITHPDKLFADLLRDDDKQVLASEFNPKAQPADAGPDPAELERQADEALRARVPTGQMVSEKGFNEACAYYKEKGCTKHVSEPFTVFHDPKGNEEPCLMIRGSKGSVTPWWHEPEQTAFEGENPGELIIEYTGLEGEGKIVHNSETGEIKSSE